MPWPLYGAMPLPLFNHLSLNYVKMISLSKNARMGIEYIAAVCFGGHHVVTFGAAALYVSLWALAGS